METKILKLYKLGHQFFNSSKVLLEKLVENEILEKVNQLDSKAIDKLKQQYWIEGIILDVDEER